MNLPIPPPMKDGVFYIDNSSMEQFTTCPRQAYYYLIRRLELNKSKIALDYGSAFHNVLEYLYKTYGTAYRSAADNEAVLKYAASLTLDTPEDDYRTISYLVDGVQKYLNDHPAEVWTPLKFPDGSPAVEIPFAMPLGTISTNLWGDVSIVWTGKIDIAYRRGDTVGIMDHKTTSMMGPQFFTEFEIAHQMYGYAAAVEYIFKTKVDEIAINGLGCRKPTKTGVKFEFIRHTFAISRPLLEEWHVDSLALVSDFFAHCERGYFPKATKWCIGKYGACQFRAVCSLNPEHRELALSTSEFRPVTWDPLNTRT